MSGRSRWYFLFILILGTHSGVGYAADHAAEYQDVVLPLVRTHCVACHSTKTKKAGLDLERFATLAELRKDLKTWKHVLEQVENGEMPPKEAKSALRQEDRTRLTSWIRGVLDTAVRARLGDPGPAPIRRLNNPEYDYTIRDLTGVDLRPARKLPAAGAAGEGFLNASEGLELSPEMMAKYFAAAKDIAAHAVLTPEGFRFSASEFQQDWVDEELAKLRGFLAMWSEAKGEIPLGRYLAALVKEREALASGKMSFADLAAREKLSPKYLQSLWTLLQDEQSKNVFLLAIRKKWRTAKSEDVPELTARITTWQAALWKIHLGGYTPTGGQHLGTRQIPQNPVFTKEKQTFQLPPTAFKPPEAVFYLGVKGLSKSEKILIRWSNPRFEEAMKEPLTLRDALLMADENNKGQPRKPAAAGTVALALDRFGRHPAGGKLDDTSIITSGSEVVEIRLPASLLSGADPKQGGALKGRRFVVDVYVDAASEPGALALVRVQTSPKIVGEGGPIFSHEAALATPNQLKTDADEFRQWFPAMLCFRNVIPTDGAVTLDRYYREDEALSRLFLDDAGKQHLDTLWWNLHFVSRDAQLVMESFGTITKGEVTNYEARRKELEANLAQLRKDQLEAEPKHLQAVLDLAARAYRRPLLPAERQQFEQLYQKLREKKVPHDECVRGLLTRVFVSPAFLLRLEQTPAGKEAKPVSDWELATRLSYFLWSSLPDDELRKAAEAGKLSDPKVFAAQARRMLGDPRARGLAIEFGTQWLEVRAFDEFDGRDLKLFPTFTPPLRAAMYEESIRLFLDAIQNDLSIWQLIDSDHTYLNDVLAKHYGIPNVVGPEWRKVTGVRKYGRGGILGLASVQTKQSGAARTSPVLRGNYVNEILLGDRLPRPPADVPKLPENEAEGELTVRQMVEKHARTPQCAICHQRIDPLGFALENFDPIGRWRTKDAGGRAIDAAAKARSGAEFVGIDGLRQHVLTQRKADFQRQFCKKLLGFALGRGVLVTDQPLLDDMAAALTKADGRISAAILTILESPQFRLRRGADTAADE